MKIVLDTNAILYFLADRLAAPLPCADFYVSVITEIELLAYPLLKAEEETKIQALLNDVAIVDLSKEIKQRTIDIRRQHRLKLPDAMVAATAYSLNAELWTNDIKLLTIMGSSAKGLLLK